MMTKPTDQPSFESRFTELQQIVERFERGDVPLAESLTLFKQGMTLVQSLESELKQTEQTLEEIERDFTTEGAGDVPASSNEA